MFGSLVQRAALILVGCGFSTLLASSAMAEEPIRMTYVGELIDDQGQPISGVFPITVHIYENADATVPRWSDGRWVSVVEGAYTIVLGDGAPLPAEFVGRELSIGVDIGNAGEISRHNVMIASEPPPQTRDEIIAELDVSFADLADRALYAEEARQADDCLMLGGRTLDELDRFDEVLGVLAAIRDDVDDLNGPHVGTRTTTLQRIGGGGGNAFTRTCPPNFVVVGMRGGAGALIDSIELICAPLE